VNVGQSLLAQVCRRPLPILNCIHQLVVYREIFIRELISNANDALEKLRLTSLTDKNVWDGSDPLNITIRVFMDADERGGKLVITGQFAFCPYLGQHLLTCCRPSSDTGIGMTPEELTTNLGTLAKSGTTDFLSQAESSDATNTGNLIGAFGLGFYSRYERLESTDTTLTELSFLAFATVS
jgi:heat shock protein beta